MADPRSAPQPQQQPQQQLRPFRPGGQPLLQVREVWAGSFDREFAAFALALEPRGSVLALDTEFPGFLRETPWWTRAPGPAYEALRENVDLLWPIQVGIAVASSDGAIRGVWSFNLRFDAETDPHSQTSLAFLRGAGIDFERHRAEGIPGAELGRRLANSSLVGPYAPCWLAFSGLYDWGYLLKLLTAGRALPADLSAFHRVLATYLPRRIDLRDFLPSGSLEALGQAFGIRRHGQAHTAGSDALLTLQLYIHLVASGPVAISMSGLLPEKTWCLEEWAGWDMDNLLRYYWGNSWATDGWPIDWRSSAAHAGPCGVSPAR